MRVWGAPLSLKEETLPFATPRVDLTSIVRGRRHGKGQEPCDLTHLRAVKRNEATNERTKRSHRRQQGKGDRGPRRAEARAVSQLVGGGSGQGPGGARDRGKTSGSRGRSGALVASGEHARAVCHGPDPLAPGWPLPGRWCV